MCHIFTCKLLEDSKWKFKRRFSVLKIKICILKNCVKIFQNFWYLTVSDYS